MNTYHKHSSYILLWNNQNGKIQKWSLIVQNYFILFYFYFYILFSWLNFPFFFETSVSFQSEIEFRYLSDIYSYIPWI